MANAGRKIFVVAGVMVSAMIVSGVALAEAVRGSSPERESRVATVEGADSRDMTSAQSQYATGSERGGPDTRRESTALGGRTVVPGSVESAESGGESGAARESGDPSAGGTYTGAGISAPPDVLDDTPGDPASQDAQGRVSRESAVDTEEDSTSNERSVRSPEIRRRVRELQAEDRAGRLQPAATGYDSEGRRQELRIAREQIVAEPAGEASLERYKELYEEAAEDYGFGDDWYVLAAVGKVESDHGQNMGPSSAGALGPMQFMPSTWESYGIDANDDGEANIMDPEDAIPAAARYLEAGGAPDDWYEALYTYNHAGWYVEKVLEVAEGYRRAADDTEADPYYLEDG